MELIAKKEFRKESHTLDIEVYSSHIKIIVILPPDIYANICSEVGYGNFDAERFALNRFTRSVFSKKYDDLVLFSSSSEMTNEMLKVGVNVPDENNNGWFKTTIIPFKENDFENELDKHISFIRDCSKSFDQNSISGKKKIAENILNKL